MSRMARCIRIFIRHRFGEDLFLIRKRRNKSDFGDMTERSLVFIN